MQHTHLFSLWLSSDLHYCSPHSVVCVNASFSFLHHTLNPILLSSQPSANNHMEEDKWQHPQKSKASEVPGSAGNSQHSTGGLWNLWMQSWESQRRDCFQRTSAGLQWVWACSHSHSFFIYMHYVRCEWVLHSGHHETKAVFWSKHQSWQKRFYSLLYYYIHFSVGPDVIQVNNGYQFRGLSYNTTHWIHRGVRLGFSLCKTVRMVCSKNIFTTLCNFLHNYIPFKS